MTSRAITYHNYLYSGFAFPESFINYVSKENLEDIDPWWLLCHTQSSVDFWCQKVKELYPERKLIPFANWLYSDDIACFDGADISGDPKVYYVHAFASAGWEDRGYVANFDEWLKSARLDATRHQDDQDDDE